MTVQGSDIDLGGNGSWIDGSAQSINENAMASRMGLCDQRPI